MIRREWSPEQIAERLRLEGGLQVSHEWIYQFIYADKQLGGDLQCHLRISDEAPQAAAGDFGRRRRGRIRPARLEGALRPLTSAPRSVTGSADTIIGKGKHALLDFRGTAIPLYPHRQAAAAHRPRDNAPAP